MTFIHKRFSRQDLSQLFVFCAFPIHVWSIIYALQDIPSLVLYMTGDEIVGSVAYNMMFTLIETLLILFVVLAIGMALPARWTQITFVPLSSIILTELAIMMGLYQWLAYQSYPRLMLAGICLLLLVLTAMIVPRYPKLSGITRTISERLIVLTSLYIVIDVVGVVIVIARNV